MLERGGHQVKALDVKPNKMSSIPGTYIVEGKTSTPVSFLLTSVRVFPESIN